MEDPIVDVAEDEHEDQTPEEEESCSEEDQVLDDDDVSSCESEDDASEVEEEDLTDYVSILTCILTYDPKLILHRTKLSSHTSLRRPQ